MNRMEALEEYQHAWKRAQRDYREKMAAGQYPYLPVLDDILQNANIKNQLPIGIVEIPLELVVGTKTAGRTARRFALRGFRAARFDEIIRRFQANVLDKIQISCIIDRPDLNRVNILARRISGPSVQKEVLKWQKQAKSTK